MNPDGLTSPDRRDSDSAPGVFAASPDLGPIPAVYAPATPGETGASRSLWRALFWSVQRLHQLGRQSRLPSNSRSPCRAVRRRIRAVERMPRRTIY
jgi:hypothetical protein